MKSDLLLIAVNDALTQLANENASLRGTLAETLRLLKMIRTTVAIEYAKAYADEAESKISRALAASD